MLSLYRGAEGTAGCLWHIQCSTSSTEPFSSPCADAKVTRQWRRPLQYRGRKLDSNTTSCARRGPRASTIAACSLVPRHNRSECMLSLGNQNGLNARGASLLCSRSYAWATGILSRFLKRICCFAIVHNQLHMLYKTERTCFGGSSKRVHEERRAELRRVTYSVSWRTAEVVWPSKIIENQLSGQHALDQHSQ